jgi:NADPH:quinone reductase-like Zn-dependent oxidoreductase
VGIGDGRLPFPEMVPNQDGAGVVDAVGSGVARLRVGDRVWLWEAAFNRADGTAQEYVALPERACRSSRRTSRALVLRRTHSV